MKTKLISAIFIFTALSAIFPEAYNWELNDAISKAMSENLVLKQRQIDLDQKITANDRSWHLLMPDLSGTLSASKQISPDPWTLSANAGISLKLDGSLPYEFKNLRFLMESEILSYEQARRTYIRDIKDFFYQILLVKERISLAEQNLELLQRQYDNTALRYESGLASDLDLMALNVSLANARPDILSLKNDYASKLFQLKYLTGLDPEDELILRGRIVLPAGSLLPDDLSGLVSDTPELQGLRQHSLILENRRKISLIESRVPSLTLRYSYSPRLSEPFGENFTSADTWQGQGSLSISLSLPVNTLRPGSPAGTDLESKEIEILKNQLAFDQLLYTSNMELSNLNNRLTGIRETLDARMLAVEFAREAWEYTTASYNSGGINLLDLQNSEKDLNQARVAVLTETYNYISAILDIEYLLGMEIIKE